MRKPTDDDYIRLIAVLGVLRCSQAYVADTLHLSKTTVNKTYQWIRAEPLETLMEVFDDMAVRSVVQTELPYLIQSSRQEDLDLLVKAGRVDRDRILSHYERSYPYEREKTPVLESQPGPAEETPEYEHQQAMLSVVRRWRDELGVLLYRHPVMVGDFEEKALHRSVDPTGESPDLFWDNTGEALVVYLPYEVDTDGDIKGARDNLDQHLEASPLHTLFEQMAEWRQAAAIDLAMRAVLLGRIAHGASILGGLATAEASEVGPTKWFSSTIAASWVDYADNRFDCGDLEGPDETGVFQVRYGEFVIIRATEPELAKRLVAIHKSLMAMPEDGIEAVVGDIAVYRRGQRNLASLTEAIQTQLDSLLGTQRIPGRCRACP